MSPYIASFMTAVKVTVTATLTGIVVLGLLLLLLCILSQFLEDAATTPEDEPYKEPKAVQVLVACLLLACASVGWYKPGLGLFVGGNSFTETILYATARLWGVGCGLRIVVTAATLMIRIGLCLSGFVSGIKELSGRLYAAYSHGDPGLRRKAEQTATRAAHA